MAMRTEQELARAIVHLTDIITGATQKRDVRTASFAMSIRDALQWVAGNTSDSPFGFGEVLKDCDYIDAADPHQVQ